MSGIDLTGNAGKAPRRGPTRAQARASAKRTSPKSLETRITESVRAVAGFVKDRGDAELGRVLDRDAPKMADVLARVAGYNPLARKVVAVIADALEPVRAFGPTVRLVWQRLLTRREERLAAREAEELLDEELGGLGIVPTPAPAEPPAQPREPEEPEIAEPWRITGG